MSFTLALASFLSSSLQVIYKSSSFSFAPPSLPSLASSLPPLISLNFIRLNPLCSELSSIYTLTSLSALPPFIAASMSAISTANSSFAPPRLLIPASDIFMNGYFWELRCVASLKALSQTPKIFVATLVSTKSIN